MSPLTSSPNRGGGDGGATWSRPRPRYTSVEKHRPIVSSSYYDDGGGTYQESDFFDTFQNTGIDLPPQKPEEGPGGGQSTETPPPPTVIVRGEEIGIVIFVLLLWVGAIALFFNRWGKIRMLEPYQPKFCESHRPSCPIADVPPINHFPRTLSKFNLSSEGSPHFAKCNYNYYPPGSGVTGYTGQIGSAVASTTVSGPFPSTSSANHPRSYFSPLTSVQQQRSRQNSVFSPAIPLNGYIKNTSRKTKSAVDLSNLILAEEFLETSTRSSKNSITNL